MIRVYYLETVKINNTEAVKGIEYIHNAILDQKGILRKLIQDTTDLDHNGLVAVAVTWRLPTVEETARLQALPLILPHPDYNRACQILATSSQVITQPEIWELLRIFGRHLGYKP